ncbi:hypothetical protein [Salipiger sp. PrR003]|uniref:hypothetical protein n=1 Tax=Salipiger sp. PrR003 TaxID=2706776 RepID=UPI0013D92D47|nr:hypothetical protein [Salipiger sp. PrR003]NDV50632.1 hypothetical protein [Salipiger sp. PrR003]
MTSFDWFLLVIIVALVLCPPKYDPAIRLKEHFERKKEQGTKGSRKPEEDPR